MWDEIADLFAGLQHDLVSGVEGLMHSVQRLRGIRFNDGPSESSAVDMANNLSEQSTSKPDLFAGFKEKLSQLAGLHSDEYKASNPDWNSDPGSPKHVVVDNAEELAKGSIKGMDALERMMSKLDAAQSPEWHAKGKAGQNQSFLDRFGESEYQSKLESDREIDRSIRRQRDWRQQQDGEDRPNVFQPPSEPPRSRVGGFLTRMLGGESAAGTTALVKMSTAIAGAAAAVVSFAVKVKASGEAAVESQRSLSAWNGQIAMAMANTDLNRMQNEMKQANATAASTKALAEQMNALRDATQTYREDLVNLKNWLTLAPAWAVTMVTQGYVDIKKAAIDGIADLFSAMMGHENELAEERKGQAIDKANKDKIANQPPGSLFFESINNQPVKPRKPLEKIQ